MKILNIVLSILILVLAIASAGLSYVLFEKRSQMVGGYEQLANGIKATASKLQAGTGQDIASGISITHKNEALDSEINKLSAFADKVKAQRDNLVSALSEMSEYAGVKIENSEIMNIAEGGAKIDAAIAAVKNLRDNRDVLITGIQQGAGQFGLSVNTAKLNSSSKGDWQNELTAFNNELKNVQNYKKQQEAAMKQIAKSLGHDISLSPARYADDLKVYNNAINALAGDKKALEQDKVKLTKDLAAANAAVKAKDNEIKALNSEVAQGKDDFTRITAVLEGRAIEFPVKMWRPGSAEARQAVQGKIIDVNKKFGYVTIDLGSESVVQQVIANDLGTNPVNPMIAEGDEMLVAKNGTTKYVGSIKIYKVDESCAFARVTNATDGSELAVGDQVFFDSVTQ